MPTVGEVYDPLVTAAMSGDANGHRLLEEAGKLIFESNPDKCPSIADGIEAAKRNLDYYCQYHSQHVAATVKEFYGLGAGYRTLFGHKF